SAFNGNLVTSSTYAMSTVSAIAPAGAEFVDFEFATAGSATTAFADDAHMWMEDADVSQSGWNLTSTWTAIDNNTVSWGAGTFTAVNGSSYSISAGNTGNMTAGVRYYIYLDVNVSTTALQTTTTASNAIGLGRVLMAVAEARTAPALAFFQTLGGAGGLQLSAGDIAALGLLATLDEVTETEISND